MKSSINNIMENYTKSGSTSELLQIIEFFKDMIRRNIEKYKNNLNILDMEDIEAETINQIIKYCNKKHLNGDTLTFAQTCRLIYYIIEKEVNKINNIKNNETSLESTINERIFDSTQNGQTKQDPDSTLNLTDQIDQLTTKEIFAEYHDNGDKMFILHIKQLLPEIGAQFRKKHIATTYNIFCDYYGFDSEFPEVSKDHMTLQQIANKYHITKSRAGQAVKQFLDYTIDYMIENVISEKQEVIAGLPLNVKFIEFKKLRKEYLLAKLSQYYTSNANINEDNYHPILKEALKTNQNVTSIQDLKQENQLADTDLTPGE